MIDDVVERGQAYLEAGATTAFVWGVMKKVITENEVKEMVNQLDGKLAVLS
jgi:2-methylisocitrate lyase-like PEP mutase family enzyme